MSNILCTFTAADGTTIEAYSTGGEMAFTRNTSVGAANNAVVASNRIRANGTSGALDYINNFTPSSQDHWVQFDITIKSIPNSNSHQVGCIIRGSSSAGTGYLCCMESRTGGTQVRISAYRLGNNTALITTGSFTPTASGVYRIRLGVTGGATPTLQLVYSDITGTPTTEVIGSNTPAGADIVTASPGVIETYILGVTGATSDSTGFHMDNLRGDDAIGTITPSSANLWDNRFTGSGSPLWSPFSTLHLQTDAAAITVAGFASTYTTLHSQAPNLCGLGYRIDNINQNILLFTADSTTQYFPLRNSGTTSIYEIINGPSFKPVSTIQETYFSAVTVWGYTVLTTLTQPTNIPRLFVLGDSLAAGADTDVYRASEMQVRYGGSAPQSYMVDGYGGKGLFNDCPDASTRTAFVATLAALSPAITTLYMEYQANDYYFNNGLWSAANYRTGLDDFLDKFHASMPNCAIYIQTMIPFVTPASEGANINFGNTAGDYRTQMVASSAARSWVRQVDGTGFNLVGQPLAYDTDGIHQLGGGHDNLAHARRRELGFTTRMNSTGNTAVNTTGNTLIRP